MHLCGAASWEEAPSSPTFKAEYGTEDPFYSSRPTISLHSHIEVCEALIQLMGSSSGGSLHCVMPVQGLFGNQQQYPIGGSHNEAALNHWQHLTPEQKTELLTVSRYKR